MVPSFSILRRRSRSQKYYILLTEKRGSAIALAGQKIGCLDTLAGDPVLSAQYMYCWLRLRLAILLTEKGASAIALTSKRNRGLTPCG